MSKKPAEVEVTNELLVVVEQSGLEKTKSQKFLDMFVPYFNRMSEIEIKEAAEASDKLAAEKKAAKAPIKQKMKVAIEALRLALPGSDVSGEIFSGFEKFKVWALNKIDTL